MDNFILFVDMSAIVPANRLLRQPKGGIVGLCKTREVYPRLSELDIVPVTQSAVEDKNDKKHYDSPLQQCPQLGLHGHY